MATLTIRNVPEETVAQIKRAAAGHRLSMEQEIRRLLGAVYIDRQTLIERVDRRVARQPRATTPGEIEAWKQHGRP